MLAETDHGQLGIVTDQPVFAEFLRENPLRQDKTRQDKPVVAKTLIWVYPLTNKQTK